MLRDYMMKNKGEKCKISVFFCGGTISSTLASEDSEGVLTTLEGSSLISGISASDLSRWGLEISCIEFSRQPSCYMTLEDIVALCARIKEAYLNGASGIVVMQGTDCLEESIFGLELLLGCDFPIVMSGSMRSADALGSDGLANLRDSLLVASNPEFHCGIGPSVIFDGMIYSARYVIKEDSVRLGGFGCGIYGASGRIYEERTVFYRHVRPISGVPFCVPPDAKIPRIYLHKSCLGDEGILLDGLVEKGYAGLVVEAMGAGHLSCALADRLEKYAHHFPVIITSRIPHAPVLHRTYGYAGGEIDLARRGLLLGGMLSGLKARLLLSYYLAGTEMGNDRVSLSDMISSLNRSI